MYEKLAPGWGFELSISVVTYDFELFSSFPVSIFLYHVCW
jgi:hypothetical protein